MTCWRMLKFLLTVSLPLLGALAASTAVAQENERIAAVVNDDIVSMRDLEERLKLAIINSRLENSPDVRRRLVPQVLRKLIEEKLQLQEAARQGVAATESEIQKTIRNIENQNGLPSGGLEIATRRDGIDFNSLLTQVKTEITWVKLLRIQYAGAIKVLDAEIEAQLSLAKSNMNRPQYLLAEIFLNTDNPSQQTEIQSLAERIVQQTKQGAPFSALARQFSQTASAATGGDIGWIYEGQLPADIEAIVKSMQPQQVSTPIRTLTGYHIFYLRERRSGAGQDKSNSVLDLAQLFLPLAQNARPDEVRAQTDLVQTAASAAENCDDIAKLAKEIGSPSNPRLGKVKVGALPTNLQAALADLPAGKTTSPQKVGGGVAVLMVCSRKDETGLPSREEIVGRLEMERMDIQARRLLRDLRRTAIVDVRI
ncbi:Parvulin-like peptidyl-prolyl isomerase [Rhodospirillaceae bacterium LM-1]|nr:Parvulin-like peptidyl-prolyl isomerase [Rhodospirillaceae bacterium LM-1]